MLWKPRQRDTFTVYTACEASDNAELQSGQILSVSVNAETRPFREKMKDIIVDLLESFCLRAATPPRSRDRLDVLGENTQTLLQFRRFRRLWVRMSWVSTVNTQSTHYSQHCQNVGKTAVFLHFRQKKLQFFILYLRMCKFHEMLLFAMFS